MHSCPKCSKILMDATEDGATRIRTRLILVGSEGGMTVICPQCKTPSKLPCTVNFAISAEPPTRKQAIKHVVLPSEAKRKTATAKQ